MLLGAQVLMPKYLPYYTRCASIKQLLTLCSIVSVHMLHFLLLSVTSSVFAI